VEAAWERAVGLFPQRGRLARLLEEGVRRNKAYESIITLGMRGDGDMPMSRESNTSVAGAHRCRQRKIIAAEVNPDVTKVPQDWALYKEVQEYYEKACASG